MPPWRCCVQDCDNETDLDAGISINNSPLSVSGRLKWKKFVDMHRKNFDPKGQFGICSIHFTNDCFTRAIHIKGTSRRLKGGAIPTIWKPKTTVSVSERSHQRVSDHESHICHSHLLTCQLLLRIPNKISLHISAEEMVFIHIHWLISL